MSWTALLLHFVIGFPVGIVVANFGEWAIHKRVLHGLGKRKGNFWNFHWYDHHSEARKNFMYDPMYAEGWMRGGWNARSKEAVALLLGAIPWILLMPWIPGFCVAALYSSANYYYKHKRSHLDPEWARKHMPWHVDHHMGVNQDANWCVTYPWFDNLLRTRERYVGTERETADREKRDRRAGNAARVAESEAAMPAGTTSTSAI